MNRHAITIWLFLAAFVGLTGCEPGAEFANNPTAQNASLTGQLVSTRGPATRLQGLPVRTPQTILISSFNIQTFGKKKLEDNGFHVHAHQMVDVLPYPHVIYICRPK